MRNNILLALVLVLFLGWSSCKKNEELPEPKACLSLNNVAVSVGDTVIVTDCSQDAARTEVYFGDQALVSKNAVTQYVYWQPGTYTVNLLAYPLDPKNDIAVASQQITVLGSAGGGNGGAATACFDYRNQLALEVLFVNCSENTARYEWDFGDKETSTEINPQHTYAKGGIYSVVLKTYPLGGGDPLTSEQDVVVELIGDPVACFTPNNILVSPEETFELLNCSENSFKFEWDFGDGAKSTQLNPKHSYATAGKYTITLLAFSADGSFSEKAEASVTVGEKYATGFVLRDYPQNRQNGETWDVELPFPIPIDGIGPEPDIFLKYSSSNGSGDTDITFDIGSGDLPLTWKIDSEIKFNNENWEITVMDDDGILGEEAMESFSGSLSDYVKDGSIVIEIGAVELEVLFEIR